MSTKAFRKEDIQGKTVIETSGKVGGKVKDVTFSLDGAITLIVIKEDGTEHPVPLKQVVGISDHVIVRGEPMMGGASIPTATGTPVCKFCSSELSPTSTWCPKCGKAQT
jgi:sporulation protein YlmC with PRC-barrel domain